MKYVILIEPRTVSDEPEGDDSIEAMCSELKELSVTDGLYTLKLKDLYDIRPLSTELSC